MTNPKDGQTVIMIGEGAGGLAAALAALQLGSDVTVAVKPEDHSVRGMLAAIRADRGEIPTPSVADYSMDTMEDFFDHIFGQASPRVAGKLTGDEFAITGEVECFFEDPSTLEDMRAHQRAVDALMVMLELFASVSGTPVTDEQRIAMVVMASNESILAQFASASADLVHSGMF